VNPGTQNVSDSPHDAHYRWGRNAALRKKDTTVAGCNRRLFMRLRLQGVVLPHLAHIDARYGARVGADNLNRPGWDNHALHGDQRKKQEASHYRDHNSPFRIHSGA